MDDDRRRKRALTFDTIAELYDQARPGYPEALFADLFALANVTPEQALILEIGCGTGQATRSLATRGAIVQCVEMGENLARLARRNLSDFPTVRVDVSRFEDWDAKGAGYDIVFAATSWHWVDPMIRYEKAAELLKPRGVLAFTTGAHVFPPNVDPFFLEIQKSYNAIGESHGPGWTPPMPEDVPDASAEILASGRFNDVQVRRYLRETRYNAESHIALMSTASDHRLMPEEKRQQLFADMRRLIAERGGEIVKHQLTILHVARLA